MKTRIFLAALSPCISAPTICGKVRVSPSILGITAAAVFTLAGCATPDYEQVPIRFVSESNAWCRQRIMQEVDRQTTEFMATLPPTFTPTDQQLNKLAAKKERYLHEQLPRCVAQYQQAYVQAYGYVRNAVASRQVSTLFDVLQKLDAGCELGARGLGDRLEDEVLRQHAKEGVVLTDQQLEQLASEKRVRVRNEARQCYNVHAPIWVQAYRDSFEQSVQMMPPHQSQGGYGGGGESTGRSGLLLTPGFGRGYAYDSGTGLILTPGLGGGYLYDTGGGLLLYPQPGGGTGAIIDLRGGGE